MTMKLMMNMKTTKDQALKTKDPEMTTMMAMIMKAVEYEKNVMRMTIQIFKTN